MGIHLQLAVLQPVDMPGKVVVQKASSAQVAVPKWRGNGALLAHCTLISTHLQFEQLLLPVQVSPVSPHSSPASILPSWQ
jgi:hypothetical protein